jgi:hypothetical protein
MASKLGRAEIINALIGKGANIEAMTRYDDLVINEATEIRHF